MSETISMTVPDEPPRRSVVLDPQGWAWQHYGDAWHSGRPTSPGAAFGRAFGGGPIVMQSLSWASLPALHGPLTVLHVAEVPAKSEALR